MKIYIYILLFNYAGIWQGCLADFFQVLKDEACCGEGSPVRPKLGTGLGCQPEASQGGTLRCPPQPVLEAAVIMVV